jgi:hypothetical protein
MLVNRCKRQFIAELEFEKIENGMTVKETTYIRSQILVIVEKTQPTPSTQILLRAIMGEASVD